jgi:hypothetical protein
MSRLFYKPLPTTDAGGNRVPNRYDAIQRRYAEIVIARSNFIEEHLAAVGLDPSAWSQEFLEAVTRFDASLAAIETVWTHATKLDPEWPHRPATDPTIPYAL